MSESRVRQMGKLIVADLLAQAVDVGAALATVPSEDFIGGRDSTLKISVVSS